MIKPNWDTFRAKFNENPQNNFEWFCYLLFCKEFKKQYGIFRFKNQSAIENDPIKSENEIIGWQAKFYSDSLSNHIPDLLSTLDKAKRDYPEITKIYIYSNREWGQHNGQQPQGLLDVEGRAQNLSIIIDWKLPSFFDSPFVSIENEIIAKHFFTLEKSSIDIIKEQIEHTENILLEIHSNINFQNQIIEINKDAKLQEINDSAHQVIVLSGRGGTGKTALIKKNYNEIKENVPFYLFKATEFELRSINDLFKNYEFSEFIQAHQENVRKVIVIDSAEKLLDLKNKDPFKEFISILTKNNWKIIFTTREHYLEDLNYHFFELYRISPFSINIKTLNYNELTSISKKYKFKLPQDQNLLELIKNPFYLNEYLQYYQENEELNYKGFKDKIWKANILKANPPRSDCFQKIAFLRANRGGFFIKPDCEAGILTDLLQDGIIGHEDGKGYFITHDIYEEWALEKKIQEEFINRSDSKEFFIKIGSSLPVRRSFRNWISELLLLKDNDINGFIEAVIENGDTESFWRDEIFISVLLSDYSDTFFDIFKGKLIENEQNLLTRLTFLLRIACKEIDNDFLEQLGVGDTNLMSLKYVFTKPKGNGWKSLIKFIFENFEIIGIRKINFILPIIYDWNNKIKEGETTRFAGLIAIKLYKYSIEYKKNRIQRVREIIETKENNPEQYEEKVNKEIVKFDKEKLIQTILYGAGEIKEELKVIIEEILQNKWKNHLDPYYDLSLAMLSKLEGLSVAKKLPEHLFKLAELFWTFTEEKETDNRFYRAHKEVEEHFGINDRYSLEYNPPSAYQTPIYWLLQTEMKKTIDFILKFTNYSVKIYANSDFDNSVRKVEIQINEKEAIEQYISHCLWNMYRGTSSPISPDLLQSIHMALEKFFLENGKNSKSESLEAWLIYLIKNSESVSITSVVTSIVLAFPEKTFNVANILFKSKEIILSDNDRLFSELQTKSLYSIGKKMGSAGKEFYENERIKTCDDKHRQWSIGDLILHYQYFKNEETSDHEVASRQKTIWAILDSYYSKLPPESKQSDSDKNWRLHLARMDKRKIDTQVEEKGGGVIIKFNPILEPELEKYKNEKLEKNSEPIKYLSLKLWSMLKFKNDLDYKKYEQYENNPLLALQEVKEILVKLSLVNPPEKFKLNLTPDESFYQMYHAIPIYVGAVLIENHLDKLSKKEDLLFCKEILLRQAISSLNTNYFYQMMDGTEPAVSSLAFLLKIFPEEKENIKIILLLSLFNDNPIGGFSQERLNIFAIVSIHKLWNANFDDAHSLLLGYLLLKPKYKNLIRKIQEENYKKGEEVHNYNSLLERFCEENEEKLNIIINNEISISELGNLDGYDLSILLVAFKLIPLKANNQECKIIVRNIISVYAKKITREERKDRIDYNLKYDFNKTYAYFLLCLPEEDIQQFLQPFLENFTASDSTADLLKEIILAQDQLGHYDNFWKVWILFKGKITEIFNEIKYYSAFDTVIKNYLFTTIIWKDNIKEWHTLKERDKRFFKEISEIMSSQPSMLFAISKILNDIGSIYLDDGIGWISNILDKNKDYNEQKLETNTIYYLENLARTYAFKNLEKIKKTNILKNQFLVILNFLIEKGSVIGYMLRESIL